MAVTRGAWAARRAEPAGRPCERSYPRGRPKRGVLRPSRGDVHSRRGHERGV